MIVGSLYYLYNNFPRMTVPRIELPVLDDLFPSVELFPARDPLAGPGSTATPGCKLPQNLAEPFRPEFVDPFKRLVDARFSTPARGPLRKPISSSRTEWPDDLPVIGTLDLPRTPPLQRIELPPYLFSTAPGAGATPPTPYQVAQGGGRHAGFLNQRLGKTPAELRSEAQNLRQRAIEHQEKIDKRIG